MPLKRCRGCILRSMNVASNKRFIRVTKWNRGPNGSSHLLQDSNRAINPPKLLYSRRTQFYVRSIPRRLKLPLEAEEQKLTERSILRPLPVIDSSAVRSLSGCTCCCCWSESPRSRLVSSAESCMKAAGMFVSLFIRVLNGPSLLFESRLSICPRPLSLKLSLWFRQV